MAVWEWHCTATLAMSFVGAVLDEPIRSSSLPGRWQGFVDVHRHPCAQAKRKCRRQETAADGRERRALATVVAPSGVRLNSELAPTDA